MFFQPYERRVGRLKLLQEWLLVGYPGKWPSWLFAEWLLG
jgi:hypothetical protein